MGLIWRHLLRLRKVLSGPSTHAGRPARRTSLRRHGSDRNTADAMQPERGDAAVRIETDSIHRYISLHRSFGRILVSTAGLSPGA
jgi:hypothetical protein